MIDKTPLPQEIESTQADVAGGPQSAVELGLDDRLITYTTKLEDADAQGLVNKVPNDIVSGLEAAAIPPSDEKLPTVDEYNRDRAPKRRRGAAIIGGAVAVATLAAGAVGIGLKGGGSEERRSDTAAGATTDGERKTSDEISVEDRAAAEKLQRDGSTASAEVNPPETTPPHTEKPAQVAPELATESSYDFMRSNGEVIRVNFITDEDIKSGKAAQTLKDVAGMYISEGDEKLLELFVANPDTVEAVDSWREAREVLGVEEANKLGSEMVVRYDTRNMEVFVKEVGIDKAVLTMRNENDLYSKMFLPKWNNFDVANAYKVPVASGGHQNQEGHNANFVKSGNYWLFTGYTPAQ